MTFRIRLLFTGMFMLLACLGSNAQKNQVCFTIDDLPLQRPQLYSPFMQRELTDSILSALNQYQIPAIGFVNESKLYGNGKLLPGRKQLLIQWLRQGMELGNHTWSHPDYDKLTFTEFKAEILAGQKNLAPVCEQYGKPLRYFRHPYLHRGNTKAKADSLADYLKSIGLIEAPVTIDNAEWIYAKAYDSAATNKDTALLRKIGNGYIQYMELKVHYFENQSEKLFGRNIKQILLIHANALNADYLKALAAMFVKNGYSFISLEEALKDKAYRTEDHYYKSNGVSWIHRWAITKGYKGDFFAGEPEVPADIKLLAGVKYE